jgi:hypothetical protein
LKKAAAISETRRVIHLVLIATLPPSDSEPTHSRLIMAAPFKLRITRYVDERGRRVRKGTPAHESSESEGRSVTASTKTRTASRVVFRSQPSGQQLRRN